MRIILIQKLRSISFAGSFENSRWSVCLNSSADGDAKLSSDERVRLGISRRRRSTVVSLKWRFCLRGRFAATPQISFRRPSVAPFPGRRHYFSARTHTHARKRTAVNRLSESCRRIFRCHCKQIVH